MLSSGQIDSLKSTHKLAITFRQRNGDGTIQVKAKFTKEAGNTLARRKPLDSTCKDQLTAAEVIAIKSIGVSVSDLLLPCSCS
jgi:hypothetical protein